MASENINNFKISTFKDKVRRPLHILQPTANNDEALVGVNRIKSTCQLKGAKRKLDIDTTPKKNAKRKTKVKEDKAVQTVLEEKIKIDVKDLTSENPSENYWKILAERRRIALNNVIAENKELHEHIKTLKENVYTYKEMLGETETLIEVLQEIVKNNPNIDNLSDDS